MNDAYRLGFNGLQSVNVNEIKIIGHIAVSGEVLFYRPARLVFKVHQQSLIEDHPEREQVPHVIKQDFVDLDEFGDALPGRFGLLPHKSFSLDQSAQNFFHRCGILLDIVLPGDQAEVFSVE